MRNIVNLSVSFLFGSLIIFGLALAADYPNRPINVVCPYAVGGSTDFQMRGIAPYLAKELKTDILIENVTGASGVIGFNKVFKSKPDGYTLVVQNIPATIITEISQPSVSYKTTEFSPICAFARDSVVLVTHPDLFKTFDEFLKAAKTNPIPTGTTGKGTTVYLAGLIMENVLGIKLNFVPFEGGSQSVATLAGKHIDAVLTIASSANALIRAGKLRPLVILANERSRKYPQVPTPKELGHDIPPLSNHVGVFAPPKLPLDRFKVLEAAFGRAVRNPSYIEWIERGTADYVPLLGKDYKNDIERMAKEVNKYKELLK